MYIFLYIILYTNKYAINTYIMVMYQYSQNIGKLYLDTSLLNNYILINAMHNLLIIVLHGTTIILFSTEI